MNTEFLEQIREWANLLKRSEDEERLERFLSALRDGATLVALPETFTAIDRAREELWPLAPEFYVAPRVPNRYAARGQMFAVKPMRAIDPLKNEFVGWRIVRPFSAYSFIWNAIA